MNPKSNNANHESKVLKFNELTKTTPDLSFKEGNRLSKESRIVGIKDHSKRQLAKKIIEKGKSY